MSKLKVTFPNSLTTQEEAIRAQVYWEEFKAKTIEDFEFAVNDTIGSLTFFPKPTELHDIIRAEADKKYKYEDPIKKIDWNEPTEQGRQIARECLNFVLNRIGEREAEEKKEHGKRFEQRRSELKKQAKTLMEVT